MYRATTILRRSRQASTIWTPTKASPSPKQCSYVAPWRWISYSDTPKLRISTLNKQIKAIDQSCHAISVTKICTLHLSADVNSCWLKSKCRYDTSPDFSGVPSLCRMYSSSTRMEPQAPQNSISSVSCSGVSEIGATDDGGNTWIDISENAHLLLLMLALLQARAGRSWLIQLDFTPKSYLVVIIKL